MGSSISAPGLGWSTDGEESLPTPVSRLGAVPLGRLANLRQLLPALHLCSETLSMSAAHVARELTSLDGRLRVSLPVHTESSQAVLLCMSARQAALLRTAHSKLRSLEKLFDEKLEEVDVGEEQLEAAHALCASTEWRARGLPRRMSLALCKRTAAMMVGLVNDLVFSEMDVVLPRCVGPVCLLPTNVLQASAEVFGSAIDANKCAVIEPSHGVKSFAHGDTDAARRANTFVLSCVTRAGAWLRL
jgi:hypothetical protein